ncbi:amidohydrolase family protein [Brevundimonas diminuta]|uniref:amidohydrolase family protein n=1 Tax=Brevundimonas diminuta TaxID=293 RepID=UPI003207F3F3
MIDICAVHGDRHAWEAYLTGFASDAPDYLRKFAIPLCERAGVDQGRFRSLLASNPNAAVHYLIDAGPGFNVSPASYFAELDEQGVEHQVLHGFPWRGRSGSDPNRTIAELAAAQPGRLTAWAGVSLRSPEQSARRVEQAATEWNARGISISPFWESIPASDLSLKPIYDAAERLRLPIWIHAGQNFNTQTTLETSAVHHIDRVATAYPSLPIIIGHAGWPWIMDAVAVIQRHHNVWLEFSSHRPSFMTRPGSGWEPLLLHARGALRGKVMFGSAAWVSRKSISELAAEVQSLPLADDIKAEWVAGNARAFLAAANRDARHG